MQILPIASDRIEIFVRSQSFCIVTYRLSFANKRVLCSHIEIDEETHLVQATFNGIGTIQDFFSLDHELLTVHRIWNLCTSGEYRLQAVFSFADEGKENQLLVPAVWYRNNTEGKGMYPTIEQASSWSFLETRMSIPCCEQLYNDMRCFTCATVPATNQRYVASVTNERHGVIISIPGSEWPYSYQGKKSLKDTSEEPLPTLSVEKTPFSYQRTFFVSNHPCQDSLEGYKHFVESLPFGKRPIVGALSWKHWFEYKLTRLLHLIRPTQDKLAYLLMGEGNGEVQEVYSFTAASFLVKSLQAAYELACCTKYEATLPCLQEARRNLAKMFDLDDDQNLLAIVGEKIGLFFLKAEQNDGVFLDCYDLKRDIWGGYLGIGEHDEFRYMVNSRCNGETMKHYVLLYAKLKSLGRENPQFICVATRVARFYCDNQLSGGSFGRWWTTKGKPGDIKGTNGAYIGSFFVMLMNCLHESDPLKNGIHAALHQAYAFYAQSAYDGSFYGDTLDADSCDKEAGVALLSFFLDMYDLEHDKRQLESAELAAKFVLQWIWQTDCFLSEDSPLAKENFHAAGMTSVSVAHHHLDFYGMAIAYEFLRLSQATGQDFYTDQARLMIDACRQLVATEDNLLGRDASFLGWQPEQINHTQWDYFDRKDHMNGVYDIDIAWVTVLTLGSYQQIEKRFPEILREEQQ